MTIEIAEYRNNDESNFCLLLASARWNCPIGLELSRVVSDAIDQSAARRVALQFQNAQDFWSWVDQLPEKPARRYHSTTDRIIDGMFRCVAHVGSCSECYGAYFPTLIPSAADAVPPGSDGMPAKVTPPVAPLCSKLAN